MQMNGKKPSLSQKSQVKVFFYFFLFITGSGFVISRNGSAVTYLFHEKDPQIQINNSAQKQALLIILSSEIRGNFCRQIKKEWSESGLGAA